MRGHQTLTINRNRDARGRLRMLTPLSDQGIVSVSQLTIWSVTRVRRLPAKAQVIAQGRTLIETQPLRCGS